METRYDLQFTKFMPKIYNTAGAFVDALGGLEVADGVSNAEDAFYLKKPAQTVTINNYDADKGTDDDSAFGTLVKQTYTNVPAKYTEKLSANIGLDKFTVNMDLDKAIADTMERISRAQLQKLNTAFGKALVDNAGKTISTAKDVEDMFNQAAAELDEKEAIGTRIAYVSPQVRSLLVDSGLTIVDKRSAIDITKDTVEMHKGFIIEVVPTTYLGDQVDAIFTVAGVGQAFMGISTMRALSEVPGFDGVQVQMAAKAGAAIPDANKAAIVVAKVTSLPAV